MSAHPLPSTPPPATSSQCQKERRGGSWLGQPRGGPDFPFDLFKYSHVVPNTLREIKQKLKEEKKKKTQRWRFLNGAPPSPLRVPEQHARRRRSRSQTQNGARCIDRPSFQIRAGGPQPRPKADIVPTRLLLAPKRPQSTKQENFN